MFFQIKIISADNLEIKCLCSDMLLLTPESLATLFYHDTFRFQHLAPGSSHVLLLPELNKH